MIERAEPVRTCVGCRTRAAKSELLRVVAVEGSLVPDPRGRLPGRGAHLHLDGECLVMAQRRRAFGRALRLDRAPDVAAVAAYVAQHASPPIAERADDTR
ncbi:MAG TPA: YlxR family protein [Mycobacteriales bacterium]|nr:YlxR family protein [Mycobacteriales bacterium]